MTKREPGKVCAEIETCAGIEADARILTLDLAAVSPAGGNRRMKALSQAIPICGGRIVSDEADDSGIASIVFEFERRHCIPIYTMLVASGLELSADAHRRLTELCQCTRVNVEILGVRIIAIHLKVISRWPVVMHCGSAVRSS